MKRFFLVGGVVAMGLAGCTVPPPHPQVVPTSTVVSLDPQPTTLGELRNAEKEGYLVVATGHGAAWGVDDRPTRLYPGERLHVLTYNEHSGHFVVRRLEENALASIEPEGLEVLTSTYRR